MSHGRSPSNCLAIRCSQTLSCEHPCLSARVDSFKLPGVSMSHATKSCNSRDPGTVTGLLADLGWNSLKQRRTKHDLTLFYQAVNGHIEIPLPPYVIPVKRNNKTTTAFWTNTIDVDVVLQVRNEYRVCICMGSTNAC